RPRLGEVLARDDLLAQRPGLAVDAGRFLQRGDRRGIVSSPHSEKPEIVEHGGRIEAIAARPVDRERFSVAGRGLSVIAYETRDVAEVDQVCRRRLRAVGPAVRRGCRRDGAPRTGQVSQVLRAETEIVLIGSEPARVSGALAQWPSARVPLARLA